MFQDVCKSVAGRARKTSNFHTGENMRNKARGMGKVVWGRSTGGIGFQLWGLLRVGSRERAFDGRSEG